MDSYLSGQPGSSHQPAPEGRGGTSLVVRQFVEILRGVVPVHKPMNEFRTVAVLEDEHYCSKCCAVRTWDVWHGWHEGLAFALGRCRCCGKEQSL